MRNAWKGFTRKPAFKGHGHKLGDGSEHTEQWSTAPETRGTAAPRAQTQNSPPGRRVPPKNEYTEASGRKAGDAAVQSLSDDREKDAVKAAVATLERVCNNILRD